ncbi:MAG TPA: cytochrome b5-like heme/steroid binding domain-containing protein [Candidatus Paceibacterota bacterium]
MSHKLLIATALVAAAVLGFAWLGTSGNSAAPNQAAVGTVRIGAQTKTNISAPPPSSVSFTLSQVAAHGNASSCWSAINGSVYDLTAWINQHPGGPEQILSICGTNGSSAFNAQHGSQARPASELANFYIGTLAQ